VHGVSFVSSRCRTCVETLNDGVLGRLAGRYRVPLVAVSLHFEQLRILGELGAVVGDDPRAARLPKRFFAVTTWQEASSLLSSKASCAVHGEQFTNMCFTDSVVQISLLLVILSG